MAGEPTINPYAPPTTDVDASAPAATEEGAFARPLFSPKQVGWATFFGSVFAGVLLLQANFRAMNRPADANKTLGLGLLAGAAIFALLMLLPRGATTAINLSVAWGLFKLADSLQGQGFFRHRTAGGARRSNWVVFGIVVATIVALLGLVTAFTVITGVGVGDEASP